MRRLPLPLLLLALWALAFAIRLRGLPSATIGSDTLGQFLTALSVLQGGGWPRPPNPEGGHSLWLMALPLLPLASSLKSLLALRFALGALIAPLAALSTFLLAEGKSRWTAAIGAGTVLALDPGLVDTLMVAFRGYAGPELLALSTLGGVLHVRGSAWGLPLAAVALVGATGQHPFSTGAALGALAALPFLPRHGLGIAVGIGFLVAIPRLLHLAWLADCGEGALACLGRVAGGSAEPDTPRWEMIRRALNDRLLVEGWLPWLGIALGLPLAASKRHRPILAWALGTVAGIVLIGLLAQSLRPYHLRLAMPALTVAAALGLSRWWPLPLGLALLAGVQWWDDRPLPPEADMPAAADDLARRLGGIPGPLRVDAAFFERPVGLEPAAVVLAAVLQGQDPDRFTADDEATLVLILNKELLGPRLEGMGNVLSFPDRAAARRWLDALPQQPVMLGGAFDWYKALHPARASIEETQW